MGVRRKVYARSLAKRTEDGGEIVHRRIARLFSRKCLPEADATPTGRKSDVKRTPPE